MYVAKILSHTVVFLFTQLMVSLAVQSILFYEVPLNNCGFLGQMESIQKVLFTGKSYAPA